MSGFKFYKSRYIEFVCIKDESLNFPEHCHCGNFVITVFRCGSGGLGKNGEISAVNAGGSFIILPYENHSLFSHGKADIISMCISKDIISSLDHARFCGIVDGALDFLNSTGDYFECTEILRSSAYGLHEKYRHAEFPEKGELNNAANALEKFPEEERSTQELASENYYSKYGFIRKFRKAFGLTPRKFRIQSRIRKARMLLAAGVSAAQTAQLSGFYDQSHFDRYFKKAVGISPAEYISSYSNFLQD